MSTSRLPISSMMCATAAPQLGQNDAPVGNAFPQVEHAEARSAPHVGQKRAPSAVVAPQERQVAMAAV